MTDKSLISKYTLKTMCKSTVIMVCAFLFSVSASAALKEMDDQDLSDVTGQAIIEVVTLKDPGNLSNPNGQNNGQNGSNGTTNNDIPIKFVRIRTGAKIEINANIDKVILGEYARNDRYTSYSTNFSPGKTSDANKFKGNYRNPLFYGGDKNKAVNCGTGGSNPDCFVPGADIGVTTGADVIIENLSLGVIENGTIVPMVMEDPYIEFAFDQNDNIIAMRTGVENQNGHLGNFSEYGVGQLGICGTSGGTSPANPLGCNNKSFTDGSRKREGGALSFSGNLNLIAGSTFLIGYSVIEGVARTNYTPLSPGQGGGILAGLNILQPNATQTVGDFNHKNTREFFISFASRPIYYPSISGDESRLKVASNRRIPTIPGVSLNMTDGIALTLPQALGTLSGGIPKPPNCYTGNKGGC